MQRVVAEQERRRPDPEYPAALVGWTQRPSRSRRASSAFMITLLELTVGSPAIRSPTGRLALTGLAGQQPLVGAAGQLVGAGLFSPLGATLLASLDAGLEGPAGDGGDPMLGRLGVLVPGGASDPGTEQLNLFTATGPTPLFGLRRPRRPGEAGVQFEERLDAIRARAPGGHGGGPLVWRLLVGTGPPIPPTRLVAGRPPRQTACLAVLLADRAVAASPTLTLQLPLPSPGHARPGAGQAKANPGLGDDLDQAGPATSQMLCHPVIKVLGPAGVVAGMLIALVEMEQVHSAQRMPSRN
jgi:hypothetical protein